MLVYQRVNEFLFGREVFFVKPQCRNQQGIAGLADFRLGSTLGI
jgi:hypothetical protein